MGIQLKSRQVPDQKLYNSIRNETYKKPIKDRSNHLRCDTGEMHDGRPYLILVDPEHLQAKKMKFPKLRVIDQQHVPAFFKGELV